MADMKREPNKGVGNREMSGADKSNNANRP